jgi:hypothetical protein
MPSSATITSFFTFVANTKAKASQANTNFSNFRGHIIPIEPLTATASDLSHDLGSDEHRWNVGYMGSLDLETSTTTASVVLKGNTSATTGSFLFQIEGVTKAVVDTDGVDGAYLKTGSVVEAKIAALAVTDSKLGASSVIAGKIADGGVNTTAKIADGIVTQVKRATASSSVSSSSGTYTTSATSFTDVTNLSVTIACVNRPVLLMLIGDTSSNFGQITFTPNATDQFYLNFVRTSTEVTQYGITDISAEKKYPPSAFQCIDSSPGTGNITFKVQVYTNNASAVISMTRCKLVAVEL